MRRIVVVLTLSLFALTTAPDLFAETMAHETTWQGTKRSYMVHVPAELADAGPRPLLVLLHGSGRRGEIMVKHWRKMSETHGIILVAPDSLEPQSWQGPHDGPGFLAKVIGEVSEAYPFDDSRIYLFGHSAGGHFALFMGLLESEYFAAVAVHAGMIPYSGESFVELATRKIPFALWGGDRDRSVLISDVERTAELFEGAGFPVQLSVMRRHDHDYYRVSKKVNTEAWEFLSGHALDGAPRYVDNGDRDEVSQ